MHGLGSEAGRFGRRFIAVMLVSGASVWAGPRMEVTPGVYDFGTQKENKGPYDFKFTVKNTGDAPLKIEHVKPGCGCTKVEMAKMELAPAESTELTGQLKTTSFEGAISKSVMVTSNDEKQKLRMLELKIQLPFSDSGPRLYPKGNRFYARQSSPGMPYQAWVWVENCDAKAPVQITGVTLPEGWACAEKLPVTVAPEKREKLTVSKVFESEPADFSGLEFTVATDFKGREALKGTLNYTKMKTPGGKGGGKASRPAGVAAEVAPAAAAAAVTATPAPVAVPAATPPLPAVPPSAVAPAAEPGE